MRNQNFDTKQWGDFANSPYPYDMDTQWTKLHASLTKQRKKNKNRRWILFFLLAGLSGALSVLYFHQNDFSPSILNSQQTTLSALHETKSSGNKVDLSTISVNSADQDNLAEAKSNSSEMNVEIISKEYSNTNSQRHPILNNTHYNNHSIVQGESTNSTKYQINSQEKSSSQKNLTPSTSDNFYSKQQENFSSNQTVTQETISPKHTKELISENANQMNTKNAMNIEFKSILPLQLKVTTSQDQTNSAFPLVELIPVEKKIISHSNPKQMWWSASISYGPSFYQSKASSEEQTSHINLRDSIEHACDGLSSEFLLGKKLGMLRIQTGIEFQLLFNKIEYSEVSTQKLLLQDRLLRIEKYQNGEIREIYGDVWTDQVYNYDYKLFNKFMTVQIPLLIGVEKAISRRYSVFADVGATLSIFSLNTGHLPQASSRVLFYNYQDVAFKKFGNAQFKAEIGLNYRFTKTLTSSIGVHFLQDMLSRTKKSTGFDEKHTFMSGLIRISKSF